MAVVIFPFCFVMGVVRKSPMLQLPRTPLSPAAASMSSTAEKGRVLLVLYRNCTRRSSDARDKIAIDRLVFFFFPLDLEPASIAKEGSQEKSWTWPSGEGSVGEE